MANRPRVQSNWADRIGRRIRLRDLHILMAVAQSGSMAKAAENLAISQPVISKAIADLEQTVGVRLFDRHRHGAELTLYGKALLQHGVAAFDELRQGVKAVEFLRDPTVGELKIAAANPMAAGIVPAIIDRLSRDYPGINYHVTAGVSLLEQHCRALHARELDLIVGWLPRTIKDPNLEVEFLFEEPTLVAAGAQNRWVKRRRIKLAELIDEPWILPAADSFVGDIVADAFQTNGLPLPRRCVFCNAVQMNNVLLATGRYLTFYPRSVFSLGADRLSIKALDMEMPIRSHPLGIITLKGRTLTPMAELFINCAREVAALLSRDARGRKPTSSR
jgi:DNA-binding transcriptional LysR family regulator